jgi:hypothetical protein
MQGNGTCHTTRRGFLGGPCLGLGGMALASLLGLEPGGLRAAEPRTAALAPRASHFAPRAKSVIFLFMAGGPSQLELFDHKPGLAKYEGQPVPDSVLQGRDLPFIERDAALMGSPLEFRRHGSSGAELSELWTHLPGIVDEIALVKSVHTDAFNHAPAQIFMNTGHLQLGKPSMGAWVTYGLGSEAADLPAFVVMDSSGGFSGGSMCFGNGFLPSVYQGVPFRSQGAPILFTENPPGYDRKLQRLSIDLIQRMNRHRLGLVGDPEIATRIEAYEMAFRLQTSAPDLVDLSREDPGTLALYGAEPGKRSLANNCLLARRLVERGVRFVSCFHSGWDHHSGVVKNCRRAVQNTDRAATALILDLKRRGLLDETLVIWGGEFGRTPMVENNPALGRARGRDHHPNAFTVWLAGGGIRGGQTIGRTDELGYHAVEDPVHVHDLQATVLHLLGLDHTRLTYKHQGRDFRLTDVGGRVVEGLLA